MWYKVRSQLYYFACEDLVLLMMFVEKALSLLNYLGTLVRNFWAVCIYEGLFLGSLFSFIGQSVFMPVSYCFWLFRRKFQIVYFYIEKH